MISVYSATEISIAAQEAHLTTTEEKLTSAIKVAAEKGHRACILIGLNLTEKAIIQEILKKEGYTYIFNEDGRDKDWNCKVMW